MLSLRHPSRALCALSPFGRPDLALTLAALRGGREACLDVSCGLEREVWPGAPLTSEILNALLKVCEEENASARPSIRLSADVSLSTLTKHLAGRVRLIERLILPAERLLNASDEELSAWRALELPLWLEVHTRGELEPAVMFIEPLVRGLVLTGSEAAGRSGEVGAYLTLQRALKLRAEAPFKALRERELILRGGVSVATGAAALALGADRLLLDEHLALCAELSAPTALTRLLPRVEPSHSLLSYGVRLLDHPLLPSELSAGGAHAVPASPDLAQLSSPNPHLHTPSHTLSHTKQGVVRTLDELEGALSAHLKAIQALSAHPPSTPLTIAQGPMTRVSDSPAFALAIAEAGGLPFLALSLLTPERAEALMSETQALLGERPWGVGVLGFAPPELREAHLALIQRFKPSAALIAGGRPAQARPLEEAGVPTYLHAPSPALTRAFLKAGVRRLVFEGAECGGHVGPSTSFSLWSAQVRAVEEALEAGDVRDPAELSLWWAGGVHDATSAALVRALSAPLALKGVEQGVVMGTAYLFTEEAVRSGAILEEYQRVALSCERTDTLHTAPGHATRCAPSPFVKEFQERSETLEREGVPSRERWATLEQLNVGRLRAASKGLEREGSELKPLSLEEQRARGMYMIGEVATLRARVTTAQQLHDEVREGSLEALARSLSSSAHLSSNALPMINNTSHNAPQHTQSDSIAIVGLSCLFPQASDHEAYWSLILDGVDAVTEVPDERWPKELYYDPEAPAGEASASKWGAFLEPLPLEPARYGLPPTTLSAVEPVQLLALEVAARALRDAGYAPLKGEEGRAFNRARASVIFGAEAGTDLANAYSLRGTLPQWVGALTPELNQQLPQLTEDSFAGVLANVIAGRVANRLDLGGANFTVDAACASSLAALDAAVKQLKLHEADLVICGGADLHNSINDYLMFSSVHALSKTGRCKPFDQSADGITLGEGVAALTLKRLSDAQRDGDRVYAVIEGVGASSDGRHFGLTAPRKEGQQLALERAYGRAGVSPAEIGLVEAHGTGTVVGDKTELSALTDTYLQAGAAPRSVALGSVKSQIGHTKCAAGMAGLIKVALSIYRRTLTPTLHMKTPNKAYEASESPFVFYDRPQPWLSDTRWGAVSAFGFGGTNFHATLREAPHTPAPTHLRSAWAQEPLVLWAHSAHALRERAARWLEALNARLSLIEAGDVPTNASLRDLAFGLWRDGSEALLQGTRRPQVGAVAFVSSWEEAREALAWLAEPPSQSTPPQSMTPQSLICVWGITPSEEPPQGEPPQSESPQGEPWRAREEVAALFPGQGAQRVGVMSELALTFGVVADQWLKHAEWTRHITPPPPHDAQERKAQAATLTDTRNAQPALGVCDLSMWSLLRGLGVNAKHLGGHSYGELVALSVAGAIPRDQLALLSAARGEAILGAAQGGDAGSMAAMKAGYAELSEALTALKAEDPSLEGVVIANLNAPQQSVISGPTEAVTRAVEALKGRSMRGKTIPVACAFHSAVVAEGGPMFEATLNTHGLNPLTDEGGYVVWSNERAAPYSTPLKGEEVAAALSRHIASPVRFVEQIEAMYEAGARLFVEVGPGRILSKLVRDILGERPHEVISCAPQVGSTAELLTALAQLSSQGLPVQWGELFEGRAVPLTPKLLGAPHPAKLLWWVNGQRAWPVKGELTQGLRPPASPLGWYDPQHKPHTPSAQLPPITPSQSAQLPPLAFAPPQERSTLMSHPSPPVTPPIQTTQTAQTAPSGALNEALSAYFENMRALAASQQQVMLALMGQGAPSLTSLTPPPVMTPPPIMTPPPVMAHTHAHTPAQASVDDWWASALEPVLAPQTSQVASTSQVEPVPQAMPTLQAEPAPQAPPQDVGALLTALVSERTGYPTEMLDPTLDLEADLGVDSIKRIEILGALGERLGLAQDGEGEAMVEELAMMKSLGEMTSWLHAKLSTPNTTDSEEGERPKAEGEGLPRAQRVWVSSPLNNITQTHEMTEPARELPHELLERALDEPLTLIHLSSGGDKAKEREELLVIPSYRELLTDQRDLPLRLLTLVQEAWLAEHVSPPQSLLVVAPHPRNTQEALALGGLNGFIKTLWRELPTLKVRLVWLEEPEEGVDREGVWREPISLELRSLRAQEGAEMPIISRWSPEEGGRLARSVERYEPRVLSAHSSAPQSPISHTQQGALLVTGGARGITAHCVRALPHLKGRLVLLCGRSPTPTYRSELWTRCEVSLQALSDELWRGEERALKRALAEALPKLERAELGALIKEGQARREISGQLSALEGQGAIARYLSVDVSDAEALAQAVHEALREASREGEPMLQVSEVLHGAGVIEDKKLKDKRLESFERVWRVKVEGARALLRVAPHAQRWVFFSSVSSALGNQGQVDYASANAALDALAEALCAEGRDALSLQWGPWGGAGMVSDVLARYYARSGVKLIELEQGLEAFAEEWTASSGAHDACITLRSWPFER